MHHIEKYINSFIMKLRNIYEIIEKLPGALLCDPKHILHDLFKLTSFASIAYACQVYLTWEPKRYFVFHSENMIISHCKILSGQILY